MGDKYTMVAKTFEGLEDVLRDELISLGAENVEMGCRMVSFEGDLETMYKANLCLRTALRILKPIEKFDASDPDELYDIVREIPWEKYMSPETTFAIDTTVNSGYFPNSRYVTYRVKDGIVDHFRDMEGKRPSIRVSGADLLFNVHIDSNRITISLDSSGEPLSKRGYRDEQTEAPINEALAAGIIMKTGWRGDCDLADPMCGSGTFLIEAALIAANINPGIYRKSFAFERWADFDSELFESLYNDDSGERFVECKILGGDIDPEAVAIARKNIKSAQVEDMVSLRCCELADWTDNGEEGLLVMNPPYGRRLKPEDINELYRGIGTCLKRNFQGWHAWIIGLDNEDMDAIGLKPSVKIPLLNGSLECTLREYVLFDGRYNDFRAEGGRVKEEGDTDSRERGPRKMKRLSDDEWKKETRKYGGHQDRKGKAYHRDDRNGRNERSGRNERNGRDERRYGNDRRGGDERRYGDEKKSGYGKQYGHSERNSYKGDKRYGRDDRRERESGPYGRDERGGRKPGKASKPYDRNQPRKIIDRGPRIDESESRVINPVHYRKRKEK